MYYGTSNPHGGDIYESNIRLDFSANVNPFGAPPAVIRAAKEAVDEAEKYPDPYCRALVKAIAAKEDLPEEDVFIGSGASELIYAYCFANRFKKAVLTAPSFAEYAAALAGAGTALAYYELKKQDDFTLREDFPEFLCRERPDAVFLCNPNNPTGRAIQPELLRSILRTARERNISLFLDECFYELSDDPFTLKNELSDNRGLFILRAFTKCYALAGLRLGYCLCADHDLLRKMSAYTPTWSVSGPAQKAGLAALKEDDYLKESVEKIRTERQYLAGELQDLGIRVCPSRANFLFFEAETDFAEKLKEKGILIRKCGNYVGLGPGYFRIAVRTREENEELIKAIREIRGQNFELDGTVYPDKK